jgi:hypothetical protein
MTSLVIKERLDSVNKLSFMIEMQLPEKYKENFDVSSEGTTSGVWLVIPDQGPSLETSKFSLYFSGSCMVYFIKTLQPIG